MKLTDDDLAAIAKQHAAFARGPWGVDDDMQVVRLVDEVRDLRSVAAAAELMFAATSRYITTVADLTDALHQWARQGPLMGPRYHVAHDAMKAAGVALQAACEAYVAACKEAG